MNGHAHHLSAQDIRQKVGHPIVDGDGHVVETSAVILDYVKQIAGADVARQYEQMGPWFGRRQHKEIFWGMPSGPNSLDRATAMLPKLYAERLEEAGIDFGICYSTAVLPLMHQNNDELRQVGHRALNTMLADMFRDVSDRLTPSAGIPMYSPEEAIAELDYVVNELGFKAATFGTEVRIAPPEVMEASPDLDDFVCAIYPVAMDSLHDYDPVWQRCLDLKIAVASHTAGRGTLGYRSSPTNYVFNHLGGFAESGDYFCRCLFLGVVTRRFPGLNFAFLEGGVGWASQLYNDLFEHWEKRNVDFMRENLDPSKLDVALIAEMAAQYGGDILTPDKVGQQPQRHRMGGVIAGELEIDEFKACEISKEEDIADLFVKPFYFGCEADDRMNAVAFDRRLNHLEVQLKAMFGSDIGHWDVTDMTGCVPHAYEMVESGLMNEDSFRDFMFTNPVSFFTDQNPNFFDGTVVEADVKAMLNG
jgi:predicted TIM-barrel fold metal-dependent hydrolase